MSNKVWMALGDGGDGCHYVVGVWDASMYTEEEVKELILKEDYENNFLPEYADDYEPPEFDDHMGENCIGLYLQEVQKKPTARLENWRIVQTPHGTVLSGNIFDDQRKRFSDGSEVHTSKLKPLAKQVSTPSEGMTMFTNNSSYLLGKPSTPKNLTK